MAAGIVTFLWPDVTLYVVSIFVAWYLIIFGAMHLVSARWPAQAAVVVDRAAARRRRAGARGLGDHPVPDSRRVWRPVAMSFPSGHAASAFAIASAMGQAAPGVRPPLRVAATTVAYSRVHTGVHYLSDVAAGAVIGNLCGGAVRRLATHPAAHAATQR